MGSIGGLNTPLIANRGCVKVCGGESARLISPTPNAGFIDKLCLRSTAAKSE